MKNITRNKYSNSYRQGDDILDGCSSEDMERIQKSLVSREVVNHIIKGFGLDPNDVTAIIDGTKVKVKHKITGEIYEY